MNNFDQGVELGRLIERANSADRQINSIHRDVGEIKKDLREIKSYGLRGGLIIGLMGSAMSMLAFQTEKADAIASLIQTLLGKK